MLIIVVLNENVSIFFFKVYEQMSVVYRLMLIFVICLGYIYIFYFRF